MVKQCFVVQRRSGMGRDEFRSYWEDTHGPIVAKVPGLRSYIQNPVVPDANQPDPPFDGIAELFYDTTDDFKTAMNSPEFAAVLEDAPNFLNTDTLVAVVVDEVTIF